MRFMLLNDLWPRFPGGGEMNVYRILKELQRRGHYVAAEISYGDYVTEAECGFPVALVGDRLKELGYGWGDISEGFTTYGKKNWLPPEKQEKAIGIREEVVNHMTGIHTPDFIITQMWFACFFHDALKKTKIPVIYIDLHGPHYNYEINAYISECTYGKRGVAPPFPILHKINHHVEPIDLMLYPICKPYTNPGTSGEFDIGQIKTGFNKGGWLFYKLAELMPDLKFLAIRNEWKHADYVPENPPPNVTFVDKVEDIGRDFFKKIKIYLHAATYEDFGMAPLESQGFGIPVIGTDRMGLKESIGDGGIMIPHEGTARDFTESEVNEYIKQIRRLLSDSEFYRLQQRKGFEHSNQMYETTMNQYDELLNILNRKFK